MRPSIALLLLSLLAAAAGADEIRLTNGRSLEGRAAVLADGRVAVETSFGTLVLAAGQVAAIEAAVPLAEQVAARRARLDPGDAEGLYRLALWVREQGAATLARQLFEEVLALDPDHAGARVALGHHRHQDRWVSEAELRALRGEVLFRGRWVPAAERDRLLAWETAARLEEAERHRLAVLSAELEARRLEWLAAVALSQPAPPIYGYGVPSVPPWGFPRVKPHAQHPSPRPHPPGLRGPDRRPPPAATAAPRPGHRSGRLPAGAPPAAPQPRSSRPSSG